MTHESEPSTPDPPNVDQVTDIDDETEIIKNFWKTTTKPILTTTIPIST